MIILVAAGLRGYSLLCVQHDYHLSFYWLAICPYRNTFFLDEKMKNFLHNIFTSADNETFSMSKVIAFSASCVMCFNFVRNDVTDMQGFGIAISALIAALAAKTWSDVK